MEAVYAHYPGLVVMTPATVEDAYSMLLEAVAIDDPVIFCEHKYLYYHLKAEQLPTEAMPVGKARIARPGRDLTLVAYSAMVHEAIAPSSRSIPIPSWRRWPGPGVCCAWARPGRGVASRRKSSRALRAKVLTSWMRPRSA
jgi:hypothetical protein